MNSAPICVAPYARVSTAKCEKCGKIRVEHDNHSYDFKGQDPEVQLRELREYVALRGWQAADVYTDVGVSGAKACRTYFLPRRSRFCHIKGKGFSRVRSTKFYGIEVSPTLTGHKVVFTGCLLATLGGFAALTWVVIERNWLSWITLAISGWIFLVWMLMMLGD